MIRYVPLYGGSGQQQRLQIKRETGHLSLTKQALDADGVWYNWDTSISIPAKSSSEIADVTAALTTMWDETRQAEMAERAAKVGL